MIINYSMFRISHAVKRPSVVNAVFGGRGRISMLFSKPINRCFGTIDHHNMSAMDVEKELFRMKRYFVFCYVLSLVVVN
jgi:hypothetical protein